MALGRDDVETAGGKRLFLENLDLGADGRFLRITLGTRLHAFQLALQTHLDVAAELDVRTTTGHVGGDGDRTGNTGL